MNQRNDAPGLSSRKRKGGTAYYWVATNVARNVDAYPVKTVRLHYDTHDERAARCRVLTAELKVWMEGRDRRSPLFDGTLGSLIDCYRTEEESPYREIKWNTRKHYDDTLKILDGMFGKRRLDALTGRDFSRWYGVLKSPVTLGGPERIRRAHNCMKLLRIVTNYGASNRYPGCSQVAEMLSLKRFALPPSRKVAMTFDQAAAIVAKAIALGRPSIALAQALQFELSLRQKDVIGEWDKADGVGGITAFGARWSGGVTWGDIDSDLILRKATTKNGTIGEWDLKRYPLVMSALESFQPLTDRIGPVVMDEPRGRPYTYRVFHNRWRQIADVSGLPAGVWNMDSRAGGITEGSDAGAPVGDLRLHATHSDVRTTERYIRGALPASNRVADLRTAKRGKREP